jgi:hypothetical protein
MGAVGPGVQNWAAITKARDPCTVQQMCIDSGHLRRGVSTQTHHSTRNLIHQLEGLQIEGLARSSQQRLDVFQQRWGDQLKAIASGGV